MHISISDLVCDTNLFYFKKENFIFLLYFLFFQNVTETKYEEEITLWRENEKCKGYIVFETDILTVCLRLLCDWESNLQIACVWI